MDGDGGVAVRPGGDDQPLVAARLPGEAVVAVGRLVTLLVREDPDLQEPEGRVAPVVLAVQHTLARAHVLHLSARQRVLVAHAVGVRERAVHHVGQDLEVVVGVRAEPAAGRDEVVVEHAEHAEADVVRVAVLREREVEPAPEPAEVAGPQAGAVDLPEHRSPRRDSWAGHSSCCYKYYCARPACARRTASVRRPSRSLPRCRPCRSGRRRRPACRRRR